MNSTKIASYDDIQGILDIQQELLIPPSDLSEKHKNTGFLIHYTPVELLEDIILNTEKSFILVVKENGSIVGYVIVYRLNCWISHHPEWEEAVLNANTTLPPFRGQEFYIQHIARKPQCLGLGVGTQLFREARKEIVQRGGTHIFGDILEKPICNNASKDFHEKRVGAKKICAYSEEPNLEWGVYCTNLKIEV